MSRLKIIAGAILTIISTAVQADFYVVNYYFASCTLIGAGCAPGGTGSAAGLVAANDYSASNIKGGPGNPPALPSPPTENFSLYPGSDGVCGVYDKFDFYTSDGGSNWSVFRADGSGAQVGTCYPKTDAGAWNPSGCCPQVEGINSLLYCSSYICN